VNKQVLDWESITERYPIGKKVAGTVRKVWKFGARIDLGPGLLGLLRNTEISWEKKIEDARQVLKQDEPVEVSILRHDKRREQLIVSIRQAKYDPWEIHSHEYGFGKIFRGQVIRSTRDNALVEFPDHMTARLPITEIVPWPIRRPDEILDTNDWVEVMVLARDEAKRSIVVSMRRRLEQLAVELASLPLATGVNVSEDELVQSYREEPGMQFQDNTVTADTEDSIRRILVVDDEEDERLQMGADLEDLGYDEVNSVGSIQEAESLIEKDEFDLILLDVHFDGDWKAGLRMAEKVRQEKPSLPIVLVTGYDWVEICRKGQEFNLAGMLKKPVPLSDLAKALRDIERRGHASWPRLPIESEGTQRAIANLGRISQVSTQRLPLKEVLTNILSTLQAATRADGLAVFSLDPQTNSVELMAFINVSEERVLDWRGNLWKSPVKDVIYDGEHIYENEVLRYEGKFFHLQKVRWFNSCIGVPVPLVGAESELGYGLFLFGISPGKFSEDDLMLAEATALVIGTAIRERFMIEKLAKQQMLTVMGGLLVSIGHEIKGRLGVLRTADRVQTAWQILRKDPGLLEDSSFVRKMEGNLRRLVETKERLTRVVDSLMAPMTQTPMQTVDVLSCLNTAIHAIAKEAARTGVSIDAPVGSTLPRAQGNRTDLEQVFLNILYNAVQHMPRTRRKRGCITIETRYEPQDEHPIQIRFKDTGPGIHTNHLDKIFDPMFTTKPTGMGMGLFICEGLLASMGGRIHVEETTIMAGTTFLVKLRKVRSRGSQS